MAALASPVRPVVLALALAAAAASPTVAQEGTAARGIGPSGLPLPRFASLASAEVNVRTGPSMEHPVRWVYTRTGLPVRIVEEFDVWRRIEDPDGETGWVHASLLSVRRTVMVRGDGVRELRRSADGEARVVARLEPGVVGDLIGCEGSWCRIDAAGERGWLPEDALWGVAAGS